MASLPKIRCWWDWGSCKEGALEPSRQSVSFLYVKTMFLGACTWTAAVLWFLSCRSMTAPQPLVCPVVGSEVISSHLSQDTAVTKIKPTNPILTTAIATTLWLQPKVWGGAQHGLWHNSPELRSWTQTENQNISSWNMEFHESKVLCQKLNGGNILMGNLFQKSLMFNNYLKVDFFFFN